VSDQPQSDYSFAEYTFWQQMQAELIARETEAFLRGAPREPDVAHTGIKATLIAADNTIREVVINADEPPPTYTVQGRAPFRGYARNLKDAIEQVTDRPVDRTFYRVLGIRSVVYVEDRKLASAFVERDPHAAD
jgi:hypothetical protein